MIKSNITLTILNNVVKDTETNPEVFEPSATGHDEIADGSK